MNISEARTPSSGGNRGNSEIPYLILTVILLYILYNLSEC